MASDHMSQDPDCEQVVSVCREQTRAHQLHTPRVSVIVTTHNRPDLCREVLHSISHQTYPALEVIVVDDASDTPYIYQLSHRFPKWTFIRCGSNRGVQHASMVGFQASSGEFVAFADDDDPWIDSDKISKQVARMLSNASAGIVTHKWRLSENGSVIGSYPSEWPARPLRRIMRTNGFISTPAALIRRTAFDEVGGFDEHLIKGTHSDVFRRILIVGWMAEFMDDVMVEVQTGHPRMTAGRPQLGNRERNAQMRVIRKYRRLWWRYPEALIFRLFRVIRSYWAG